MDCSLEDLFAEPPPKVADDAVNTAQSKGLPNDTKNSTETLLNATGKCPSDLEGLENIYTTLSNPAESKCNIEERRTPEEREEKTVDIRKRYHVPTIEDILGSSMLHEKQRKRNSFGEDIEGVRLRGQQDVIADIKLSSKTPDQCERKCISDTFKEQFKQKNTKHNSEKMACCTNGTLKRKSGAHESDSINIAFETKSGNDGNVNNETTHAMSKRKKAGNYQRKLHTKCRISAKEIQKLTNEQNDDYQEFFADIGRSMDLERSSMANTSIETNQSLCPINANMDISFGAKNKSGRKKSKKKWKNKKRKDRINKLKESKLQEKDDVIDDEGIILSPRNDAKPHKWPVSKQIARIEGAKKGNGSDGIYEKGETKPGVEFNENHNSRKVDEEGRNGIENAVLDSILKEVACLGGMMKEGTENNNKTQSSTSLKNDILKHCKLEKYFDMNTLSFDSILECVRAVNENRSSITKLNHQGKSDRSSIDSKNYSFKKESKETCPYHNFSGPEVSKAQWFDDTEKIFSQSDAFEVKNESGMAISGKNERTTCCNEQIVDDDSVNKHSNENNDRTFDIDKNDYNDVKIHTGNSLNLNAELKSKSDNDGRITPCISPTDVHEEAMHVKQKGMAETQKIQRMPGQLSGERSHRESLLSNVCGLPVDLAIAGKEKEQLHSGKRKRGGRKKKEKRKNRCNAIQTRTKAEEKTIAKCKFFLDGKCNKGADCRFLHEGIPQRRELCRYYVTDSCLADDCIFMHSEFPCKFFHGLSKCANGSNCKYSHEPLTEETKKLLDELFARDDAIKKEGITLPSQQNNDIPAEELVHEKETDQTCPSLYSSLI